MTREHEVRGSEAEERAALEVAHSSGCECVRCVGFKQGNEVGLRHGAYSELQLAPRSQEVAGLLRATLIEADLYDRRFEGALAGAAIAWARCECADLALDKATAPSELQRLEQDLRAWQRHWRDWLGLNLTRAKGERLRAHLDERYEPDGDS